MNAGVCWYMLVYTGVCWCMLVYVGVCWCVLVYAGVCWCMLVYVGVLDADVNLRMIYNSTNINALKIVFLISFLNIK